MFKRLRWLVLGLVGGLASSFWVNRKLRRAAAKVTPRGLAGSATSTARQVVQEVRSAVSEGRTGMQERERELRAEIGRPAP